MRLLHLLTLLILVTPLASAQIGHDAAPGGSSLSDWHLLVEQNRSRPNAEKILLVNQFFNERLRFGEDSQIWQQQDYWATPRETLLQGQGDCEDFVIAKYFTLLDMGMSADNLRLIYVRARIGGPDSGVSQMHMVLGYYPALMDEPLILDNLVSEIRTASRRPDLTPVFSFNSTGLWTAGSTSIGDPSTKLSRWRNVLSRMQEEGSLPQQTATKLNFTRGY